jgi:hypothetical protein
MFRTGLYARVSTNDQQTLPMQNRALREYAARRSWVIAMQVREVGSGAAQRQAREKLLETARRREINVVLVWRLDRWGRSVTDLLATLQELEHQRAHHEPHDHGILNSSVQLLGHQIAGSSSRPLPNWLLMKTDEVTELEVLEQTFPGGRPTSTGNHIQWDKLFIRVKPAAKRFKAGSG